MAAFIIGIILLLPGACAIVFIGIGLAMEGIPWTDPFVLTIVGLWVVCLLISFGGVLLIRGARQRWRADEHGNQRGG